MFPIPIVLRIRAGRLRRVSELLLSSSNLVLAPNDAKEGKSSDGSSMVANRPFFIP